MRNTKTGRVPTGAGKYPIFDSLLIGLRFVTGLIGTTAGVIYATGATTRLAISDGVPIFAFGPTRQGDNPQGSWRSIASTRFACV